MNITKDSIFHINTNLSTVPKDIYLVGSEETARREFKNAYILYYVDWHKISGILDFFTNMNLEERVREVRTHQDVMSLVSETKEKSEKLKGSLLSMVTVIPFTPVKYMGANANSVSQEPWSISEGRLALKGEKNWNNASPRAELRNFYNTLFETAGSMGIILRGIFYESPCIFCKSVFSKIANKCEIYNTKEYSKRLCSPRVFFASHIMDIESGEESLVDYSSPEVLSSLKLEV